MTELTTELQVQGFEITVLASSAPYNRSAERLPLHEEYKGVHIRRLWGTRFDKRNLLGRIINLITFISSMVGAVLFARPKPDLLFISNAPFFGMVGRLAKFLRGQKYVCLIQDVYPDLAVVLGIFGPRSPLRIVWDAINRSVYPHADGVIVLGERMKEKIAAKLPASAHTKTRLHVIADWADGDQIKPLHKSANSFALEHGLVEKTVILYSGNHGLAHDLETLLQAADRLRDDPRFVFLFIGDGGKKPALVESANRSGLRNVVFLPYQPKENLPLSLTCGDVSVVTMEPGVQGLVIPSKIYGCLAAGQAVVALVDDGTEVADIIEDRECGIRVSPRDTDGLVDAIQTLCSQPEKLVDMKHRARRCFDECFTKQVAVRRYRDAIHEAIAPLGRRGEAG